MSKRAPNELETRLHQAALSSAKKVSNCSSIDLCIESNAFWSVSIDCYALQQEITAKQAESVIPDPTARQNALNFLLGVGLLKGLTGSSGQVSFRAVSKEEIVA